MDGWMDGWKMDGLDLSTAIIHIKIECHSFQGGDSDKEMLQLAKAYIYKGKGKHTKKDL